MESIISKIYLCMPFGRVFLGYTRTHEERA